MKKEKRERLANAGWRIGSAADLLGLSKDEEAFVEMKLSLAAELRRKRLETHMTQAEAARALESSQSRVAKMEAGDPSVSLDLLVRSLLAMGATRQDVAAVLASGG